MKKLNICKSSLILYVFALLFIIGFGISFYNVTTYVNSLVEAGSLSWGANWVSIVLYYISNTGLCLGFAIVSLGLGYGIQLLKDIKKSLVKEQVEEVFAEDTVKESVE